jgi:curved DNA-binding protein CbpA
VDVYSLPLSTREGFVLSRVDGVSSVEDISMMVGIKVAELLTMLEKLAGLGAVELSWLPQKPVAQPTPPRAEEPDSSNRALGQAAVQRVLATPIHPLYDELELLAKADIGFDLKKKILNGFYGLDGKDYYQLLGLLRSADRKEVRAAYFELSKLFHPDSLFGKELGPFKAKMEAVFKRLTEAYEVLGRSARRKEYDEYLAATETTSALQHTFDQVQHEVEALDASPVAVPAPPPSAASEADNEWPVGEAPRTLLPPPTPEARREASIGVRPPPSIEDRKAQARQRLQRSLTGTMVQRPSQPPAAAERQAASGSGPAATSATANSAERRDSAIRGLRQGLRQSTQTSVGMHPILAQLRKARDAEQAGDLLGAASALQAALSLEPNHKDLQAQYARVSKAVARSLADNYEKQARYEEKQGKWSAAATSWERVSEGRPEDPHAARAVAEALLKASGDLRKAQRHAQRAVDAAPSDITNVVVLGRVFLAAGMRANARRELEKAVKLDPQNEMIKNLLREAR